eukprot:TRINITY_DN19008_c0_g2_i2.p1 TRINITY_DN19008_c0_g2~~TRINITY_DN19008_c0_g2_i2.p1  ORF type:complete len:223 (-),score=41.86 TRINITY_DN19008_c0_g2_i2:79-747(-)
MSMVALPVRINRAPAAATMWHTTQRRAGKIFIATTISIFAVIAGILEGALLHSIAFAGSHSVLKAPPRRVQEISSQAMPAYTTDEYLEREMSKPCVKMRHKKKWLYYPLENRWELEEAPFEMPKPSDDSAVLIGQINRMKKAEHLVEFLENAVYSPAFTLTHAVKVLDRLREHRPSIRSEDDLQQLDRKLSTFVKKTEELLVDLHREAEDRDLGGSLWCRWC